MEFVVIFLVISGLAKSVIVSKLNERVEHLADNLYWTMECLSKIIEDEKRDGRDTE